MKITDLLKSQDSRLIQKLFMNIPVKDYLTYVYNPAGIENLPVPQIEDVLKYSDCNSDYIFDFDEPHMGPDKNITVGQMLKIAYNMFPVNAEKLYSVQDRKKAEQAAMNIVASLLVIPFATVFSKDAEIFCFPPDSCDLPANDEEDEDETSECTFFDLDLLSDVKLPF